MITTNDLNIMNTQTKNKLNTTATTYVNYGKAKNAQWNAEDKHDVASETARQASRILADEIVAIGGGQIDLIAEPKKEKPIRMAAVSALIDPMTASKKALLALKGKELKKPATKEQLALCPKTWVASQQALVETSDRREFISKSDVKNKLTGRINTAIDDLKAMVAYRLGEEKLSGKDGKAGIAPTKRADKKAVKKERVSSVPLTDIQKIHALLNEIIAIWQNTTCPILKKVNVLGLSLVQKIVNLLK